MAADQLLEMHDPYRRCEKTCSHDLVRGLLVEELLADDGPYPDEHPLLNFRPLRASQAAELSAAS